MSMFNNNRIPYSLDYLKDTTPYLEFSSDDFELFKQAGSFIGSFRDKIRKLVGKRYPSPDDFKEFLEQTSSCERNLNYLYLICLISYRFKLLDNNNYDCLKLAKNSKKVWEQYQLYFNIQHIKAYFKILNQEPCNIETKRTKKEPITEVDHHETEAPDTEISTINIVHVSDIHIADDNTLDGKNNKSSSFQHASRRLKTLLSSIDDTLPKQKKGTVNLLLVTGDIVFKYYDGLYDNILSDKRFEDVFSDNVFDKIIMIPGNHDFDKTAAINNYSTGGGFYKFPYKDDNGNNKNFYIPKDKFTNYTKCYYDFLQKLKKQNDRIINDYDPEDLLNIYHYDIGENIRVITYNSSPFVYAHKESYQNQLTELFMEKCKGKIDENKFSILVGHHPLTGIESISQTVIGDKKRYEELIQYITGKFNLYLHGHRHTNDASNGNNDFFNQDDRQLCVIGAGSQEEQGLRARNLPKSYNLISIEEAHSLYLRTFISNSCSGPDAWSACTFALSIGELNKLKKYINANNLRSTVKHIPF